MIIDRTRPFSSFSSFHFPCLQDHSPVRHQPMVLVPSTRSALHQLAEAVSVGRAVLLEGAVGTGKTSIVQHLAVCTGHRPHLVVVQLNDQTDSKVGSAFLCNVCRMEACPVFFSLNLSGERT